MNWQRRSLRERKKKNYNDDYDYNISDDEEKKKGENGGEQVNIDLAAGGGLGGHKLIPYKPSDAVEGEIAIVEKILACRIRSNIKVLFQELFRYYFCCVSYIAFVI